MNSTISTTIGIWDLFRDHRHEQTIGVSANGLSLWKAFLLAHIDFKNTGIFGIYIGQFSISVSFD